MTDELDDSIRAVLRAVGGRCDHHDAFANMALPSVVSELARQSM